MNQTPEAIQEEILDKFHFEICQWTKQRLEVELGDLITADKRITAFVSVNEYIKYNHTLLINELKQSIVKRNTPIF